MTFFTDIPFQKMSIQTPTGGRQRPPPVPVSPACVSCPYRGQAPCVGYSLKQLREKKFAEVEQSGNDTT